jgi:hypothetical protein
LTREDALARIEEPRRSQLTSAKRVATAVGGIVGEVATGFGSMGSENDAFVMPDDAEFFGEVVGTGWMPAWGGGQGPTQRGMVEVMVPE